MEENKQHKTALPETEPIPSAQAPEALLDIRGLRVEYHTDEDVVYAVNGLDLTIGKGESLGLVGETGAGKTTTALGIMGLVPDPPGEIVGGSILFEDQDLLKLPEKQMREIRGGKISMIFQDPMTSLNPVMTVGAQIAEAVGHPKAVRAVGSANNRNPIPFIVPCHRVVGANGNLVGYAYGVEMKRSLLQMEMRTLGQ